MVLSMTGFATTSCELHPTPDLIVHATLTIKTLNSKFFEINCRLPYALAPIEPLVVQKCKELLKRGSVSVVLYLSNPGALRTAVTPSLPLAESYVSALRLVQKHCNLPGELRIQDLVTLPNLFESGELELKPHLIDTFMDQFITLLQEVHAARIREGKALQEDLEQGLQQIATAFEEVEARATLVSQERRKKFTQEVEQLLASAPQDVREHHLQTLYQQVNTLDVHEELVRFRTHHKNFLATLHDQEIQKGKKLDFILQELFREINTLNAKLADSSSIGAILVIKTKLEQAREQVQNIV